MKHFIIIFALLFSVFCSAQNTGSMNGIILDGEEYNEPLMLANVYIKGTSIESNSDENGLFHFEDLAEGNYTLAFSFVGYETKEVEVKIASNKSTNISVTLTASTISLNDLASLNIVAKQEVKTSNGLNN